MIKDPVFGFDISGHQPYIDWTKVKNATVEDKPIEFCIIKKSQGSWFTSDQWMSQYEGCQLIDMPCTLYHWFEGFSPNELDAKYFLQGMPKVNFPIILDFEDTRSLGKVDYMTLANRLKNNLEYLTQHTGHKPLVYTADWFMDTILAAGPPNAFDFLLEYRLWVANYPYYGYSPTFPVLIPRPWTTWDIWQYTNKGRVNGITNYLGYATNVDCDVIERSVWEEIQFKEGPPPEDPIRLLEQAVRDINRAIILLE